MTRFNQGHYSKLREDEYEDFTVSSLPVEPCRQCANHPIKWPHSICQPCIDEKRSQR